MTIRYPLQTIGGSGVGTLEGSAVYSCDSAVAIGQIVHVSGIDAVAPADADGIGSYGRLGVISEKPSSTTCRVIYSGDAAFYSGLVVGSPYYLSTTPGAITAVRPSAPSIAQLVGWPRNPTTLIFDPDQTTIIQQ
jgi:hypothetical protein